MARKAASKPMASTPKVGIELSDNNQAPPIRGNLRFSPSPEPAKQKSPARKRVTAKRKSIGVPVKIAIPRGKGPSGAVRSRKRLSPSKEEKDEEFHGTYIVDKEDQEPEETTPVKKKTRTTRSKAQPAKKQASSRAKKNVKDPKPEVIEFSKFKFDRVINDSSRCKMITLLGTYNGEDAVIRLEKTFFDEEAIKKALSDKKTTSSQDFANDVYSSYSLKPTVPTEIKAVVVCPANEKVLAKYTRSEKVFFSETPDAYAKVVEPYIENLLETDENYNNWVYNILDGKSEVERVLLDDPDENSGFMLVPDLKWSGDERDINFLAICHRRDIRSLRDLTEKHLILLKNILTKGTKAIKDKFKNIDGQLRLYIHYQPSFYHFHVHFKVVDPNDYEATDRDNLLGTVINNITLNKDYYKKSTLTYPLPKNSALYTELEKAKRF